MNFEKIFGGTNTPIGYELSKKKVPKGYSKDKAYQNQKAAGSIGTKTSKGAGKDGLKISYGQTPYYKIENGPPAPQQQQQQEQPYQAQSGTTSQVKPSAASKKYLQEAQDTLAAADKTLADFNAAQSAAAKAQSIAASNQSMAGKSANLQLQPASSTSQTAGTQGFKKLKNQFKIKPSYNALNTIKSGVLNI